MLASSYPLLSIFWSMLMFAGLVILLFLIIWCFIDDFRHTDHGGWAKFGWTLAILFVPVLGALVYILVRPAEFAA